MASVDEFIKTHRSDWEQLESLLRRAGRQPSRLEATEIERLSQLYRHVTSDLALARRDFPHEQATRYLNDLAARAHPLLYRPATGSWHRFGRFFFGEFPSLYRQTWPFILTAAALFILPALAAYLLVLANPALGEQVLPGQLTRLVRAGRLWTEIEAETRPLAASMIMTNNIQVSILAFAGGILLGTLSIYVLVLNGLLFGAIFAYTQVYGLAGDLAGFVSPHGYVELSVVFIAGGAGLQLAWAILQPGLLTRREALGLAGQRAVLLLVGAIPLLVIAGLIEGFVSPSGLPREAKWAFGLVTAVALYGFLLRPSTKRHLSSRLPLSRRAALSGSTPQAGEPSWES